MLWSAVVRAFGPVWLGFGMPRSAKVGVASLMNGKVRNAQVRIGLD